LQNKMNVLPVEAQPTPATSIAARRLPGIPDGVLSNCRRLTKKRLLQYPHLLVSKPDRKAKRADSTDACEKSFFGTSSMQPMEFITSLLEEQSIDAIEFMKTYSPESGRNVSIHSSYIISPNVLTCV
jgi:hypothetical protein